MKSISQIPWHWLSWNLRSNIISALSFHPVDSLYFKQSNWFYSWLFKPISIQIYFCRRAGPCWYPVCHRTSTERKIPRMPRLNIQDHPDMSAIITGEHPGYICCSFTKNSDAAFRQQMMHDASEKYSLIFGNNSPDKIQEERTSTETKTAKLTATEKNWVPFFRIRRMPFWLPIFKLEGSLKPMRLSGIWLDSRDQKWLGSRFMNCFHPPMPMGITIWMPCWRTKN